MNASLGTMYVTVKNNNNMRIFKYVQGEPSMMWFLGTRSSTAKPQLSSRYVKFWPCQAWRSQIAAPTAQKTTSLTVLPVGRRHGSFSTPHCQFFGIFVQNCQIYFLIISTFFFALFNNFQDMSHKFHCMVFHTFT